MTSRKFWMQTVSDQVRRQPSQPRNCSRFHDHDSFVSCNRCQLSQGATADNLKSLSGSDKKTWMEIDHLLYFYLIECMHFRMWTWPSRFPRRRAKLMYCGSSPSWSECPALLFKPRALPYPSRTRPMTIASLFTCQPPIKGNVFLLFFFDQICWLILKSAASFSNPQTSSEGWRM